MCNLYSLTKGHAAIRGWFHARRDHTGNLPLFQSIFPDQMTPIVPQPSRWRSSWWGDDGRPAATDEANRQNLPRDRRAKPSGEMQRRAVAYPRHHGIGKRSIVRPAAA
jgi:hypothetical protein